MLWQYKKESEKVCDTKENRKWKYVFQTLFFNWWNARKQQTKNVAGLCQWMLRMSSEDSFRECLWLLLSAFVQTQIKEAINYQLAILTGWGWSRYFVLSSSVLHILLLALDTVQFQFFVYIWKLFDVFCSISVSMQDLWNTEMWIIVRKQTWNFVIVPLFIPQFLYLTGQLKQKPSKKLSQKCQKHLKAALQPTWHIIL